MQEGKRGCTWAERAGSHSVGVARQARSTRPRHCYDCDKLVCVVRWIRLPWRFSRVNSNAAITIMRVWKYTIIICDIVNLPL